MPLSAATKLLIDNAIDNHAYDVIMLPTHICEFLLYSSMKMDSLLARIMIHQDEEWVMNHELWWNLSWRKIDPEYSCYLYEKLKPHIIMSKLAN